MDLQAVRDGIKAALDTLPDTRCYDTVPGAVAASTVAAVVVEPGDPYVTYPDAQQSAKTRQALIAFRLMVIPGTASLDEAQDRIDDYLSAGTGRTKSIHDKLRGQQTLSGTSCVVMVQTARVVQLTEGGVSTVAGQIDIEITARTD